MAIGVMVAFVAAGVLGFLGVREGTQTADGENLRFEISYPVVTRGGLPTRWVLEIRAVGAKALPGEIEVRTTATYFEVFDHNAVSPEPDHTWQDDVLRWTFRPGPQDDRLRIELDVRTQPDARWRYRATTDVVIDGATAATFEYATFVVP